MGRYASLPPSTAWLNFVERVGWTLLQAASAEGILGLWSAVTGQSIAAETRVTLVIVLTTVLAAVKNAAAQAFGSPTGSTLPKTKRPVPADKAAVIASEHRELRAGPASRLPNGARVSVESAHRTRRRE